MNRGVSDRCAPLQRMWRGLCALLALACAGLITAPAQAQTASTTGAAQAAIVEPLALLKLQDLRFGRMAVSPTAGTVTVNPNTGACTVTGGVISTGSCGYAEFGGQGVRRMRVRIQLPTTITLTGPGGATMVANNLTLGLAPDLTQLPGAPGNPRYEIASNSGIFTFRVGARLNVGANQAPGIYTGTFAVTVQYQ